MKFFESFFNKERCASTVVVTMGITATIIFLLYIHLGLAPFGLASLAVSDARIQYLDFFSFYKRVLSGNESVIYIMGPLSRPRSKILRVAVSRIILSSEASKVKLVGNLVA